MRVDFLSTFLEEFRGPRKKVFCLKMMRSKSAGNHAKSKNFQGLVFVAKAGKLILWDLKWKGKNK